MAIQARTDRTNLPFVVGVEKTYSHDNATVVTNGSRSGAMALYTLMVQVPSSEKWTSFIDETATDGTQIPQGILMKSLTEAEIKAADVVDVPILYKGVIDREQLIIEASKTLATVITTQDLTVEKQLGLVGIYCRSTDAIDGFEN